MDQANAAVGPLLANSRSISRRMAPRTTVTNSKVGSGVPLLVADGPMPSSPRNLDSIVVNPEDVVAVRDDVFSTAEDRTSAVTAVGASAVAAGGTVSACSSTSACGSTSSRWSVSVTSSTRLSRAAGASVVPRASVSSWWAESTGSLSLSATSPREDAAFSSPASGVGAPSDSSPRSLSETRSSDSASGESEASSGSSMFDPPGCVEESATSAWPGFEELAALPVPPTLVLDSSAVPSSPESAAATAGPASPIPRATANAPTRPTNLP